MIIGPKSSQRAKNQVMRERLLRGLPSKWGPFLSNTIMRNILGQTKSGFNISRYYGFAEDFSSEFIKRAARRY